MNQAPALRRPAQGARLGGVCLALAERWMVDPLLVRVAFVIAALAGGVGIACYVAGLLLIPRVGSSTPPVRRVLPFTREWSTTAVNALVVILGLGVVVVVGRFAPLATFPLLAGGALWFFGYHRPQQRHRRNATLDTRTEFQRAADSWRERVAEHQRQATRASVVTDPAPPVQYFGTPVLWAGPSLPARPAAEPVPVSSHRPRSWLFGLVAAGVAAAALAGVNGVMPVPPVAWTAAGLLVVAITLLASIRRRRPGGLIGLGVVLSAATLAMAAGPSAVPVTLSRDTITYTSVAELPSGQQFGIGDVDLDLSALALDSDVATKVEMNTGDLAIRLPRAGNVEVHASVKVGELQVPGRTSSGFDLDERYQRVGDPNQPTLTLDVALQTGKVSVTR